MAAGTSARPRLAWIAAALALCACPEPPRAREDPAEPGANLLLISLDTLRADHLGCYGAPGNPTPRMDALARAGVRFARVIAPDSFTLSTHASLLTGQHPLVHGATRRSRALDPVRSPLLAERLRRAGYRTAAFTGGGFLDPRFGFGAGFDAYAVRDPAQPRRPGERPLEEVLAWLERNADRRFFLFVHTFLVHDYRPAPAYLARLDGAAAAEGAGPSVRELQARIRRDGDPEALARLQLLYRASVRQADEQVVGALLDALERLGVADRTFVSLVSDHGEEFREHGGFGHGRDLWGEVTNVPWLLRGPGLPAGAVVGGAVPLEDVAPTLARLLGLEADPRVGGRPRWPPAPADEAPLLLSRRQGRHPQDALVQGDWKLLQRREGGGSRQQLFRLDRDPGEARDLAGEEPDRLQALARQLDDERARLASRAAELPGSGSPPELELSPELEERLRELGYGSH